MSSRSEHVTRARIWEILSLRQNHPNSELEIGFLVLQHPSILSRQLLFWMRRRYVVPSARGLSELVSPNFLDFGHSMTGLHPAFMTDAGTGYLQSNFSVRCSNCSQEITKDSLAVRKLAEDLTRANDSSNRKYLASAFLSFSLRCDTHNLIEELYTPLQTH